MLGFFELDKRTDLFLILFLIRVIEFIHIERLEKVSYSHRDVLKEGKDV